MDLLLCRYSDMGFVMDLPPANFLDLVEKAAIEKEKDKVWQKWVAKYPWMAPENFMTFEEFYAQHVGPAGQPGQGAGTTNQPDNPQREPVADAERILKVKK